MSTGILLLTYGSATTSDGVRPYLSSVYAGRPVPEELIREFERRYEVVGRSPLVDITLNQGRALQRLLDAQEGPGRYRVEVGMLHSEPGIRDAVRELTAGGVDGIIAIVLAPQLITDDLKVVGQETRQGSEQLEPARQPWNEDERRSFSPDTILGCIVF